jgi:hypothetical protein
LTSPLELIASPHSLYRLITENRPWNEFIYEAIDNSLEDVSGNADLVTIVIGRTSVTIADDGRGISDMNRLARPGASGSYSHAGALAQYGFGAKIWMCKGRKLTVTTVHDGRRHKFIFDTKPVEQSDFKRWITGYGGDGTPTDKSSGTKLIISELRKNVGSVIIPSLMAELQRRYWIGLRNGKKIVIRDERKSVRTYEVSTLAPPSWSDTISFSSEGDGQPYRAKIGILNESVGSYHGLFMGYSFRTIVIEETFPSGRILPARIHGQVELSTAWRHCFSMTKDKIVKLRDELLSDIEEKAKEVLDKAESLTTQIRLKEVALKLQSGVIAALFKHGRGRSPLPVADASGGDEGSKSLKPVESTEKRKRPKTDQPVRHDDVHGIEVKFESLGYTDTAIVAVGSDWKTCIVTLNKDCPKIAHIYDPRNTRYPSLFLMLGYELAHFSTRLDAAQSRVLFRGMLGEASSSDDKEVIRKAILAFFAFIAGEDEKMGAAA